MFYKLGLWVPVVVMLYIVTAMEDWISVERGTKIEYDLESYPLQVQTNDDDDAEISIDFYGGSESAYIGYIAVILTSNFIKYSVDGCITGYVNSTFSKSDFEAPLIWTFKKTSASLVMMNDDTQIFEMEYAGSSEANCSQVYSTDVTHILFSATYDDASVYYRPAVGTATWTELIHGQYTPFIAFNASTTLVQVQVTTRGGAPLQSGSGDRDMLVYTLLYTAAGNQVGSLAIRYYLSAGVITMSYVDLYVPGGGEGGCTATDWNVLQKKLGHVTWDMTSPHVAIVNHNDRATFTSCNYNYQAWVSLVQSDTIRRVKLYFTDYSNSNIVAYYKLTAKLNTCSKPDIRNGVVTIVNYMSSTYNVTCNRGYTASSVTPMNCTAEGTLDVVHTCNLGMLLITVCSVVVLVIVIGGSVALGLLVRKYKRNAALQ